MMMRELTRLAAPGSLAVAAVMAMGWPAAQAAEVGSPDARAASARTAHARATCGQPAVEAVFETVVHDAVYETVPAVTGVVSLWTRQVPVNEDAYIREVSPGYSVLGWSRTITLVEREFSRTVVDQVYVPAVPGTAEVGHTEKRLVTEAVLEHEFVHRMLGETRWERAGWNAGDNGRGWSPTGITRELVPATFEDVWVVDQPATSGTPEVPLVTHVETIWLADGASAAEGFSPTGATRPAGSRLEQVSLREGQVPDGDGWVMGGVVEVVDAVVDIAWVPWGDAAPDGYAPTGASRPTGPRTETTATRSASAPAGEGWSSVPGSDLVVVLVPEQTVLVTPGWTEQVLVSPGVPCPDPDEEDPDEDDPDEDDPDEDDPDEDDPDVVVPGGQVPGGQEPGAQEPGAHEPGAHEPGAHEPGAQEPGAQEPGDGVSGGVAPAGGAAEAGVDTGVLPAAGAPVPVWLTGVGVGSLLAGGVLLVRRRRVDPVA